MQNDEKKWVGADTVSAQLFFQKLDQETSIGFNNKLSGNLKRFHFFLGGDVNPLFFCRFRVFPSPIFLSRLSLYKYIKWRHLRRNVMLIVVQFFLFMALFLAVMFIISLNKLQKHSIHIHLVKIAPTLPASSELILFRLLCFSGQSKYICCDPLTPLVL